jgi:hypothetical protein
VLVSAVWTTACSRPFGREYEYEEQLYLSVDGSATVILNSSIAALVALRGAALDPAPGSRIGRDDVRELFEASGCDVVRVGQLWRRKGRRFVQVRLRTDDVRLLSQCRMLSWSTYGFSVDEAGLRFEQRVGPGSSGGEVPAATWKGDELVAFRLHLPSRILHHNLRRLSDGAPGEAERGNILTYEQRLVDRRAGKPIAIDVRLETQPILYRTLLLFGGSFAAALVALGLVIWLIVRRGRRAAPAVRRPDL